LRHGTIVEVEGAFVVTGPDIESHLDQVMSETVDLDCGDPSVSVSLRAGRLVLSLEFDQQGRRVGDAIEHAMSTFRTAIHAAGGGIPTGRSAQHSSGRTFESSSSPPASSL